LFEDEKLDYEKVRNNPADFGIEAMEHGDVSYSMGYLETVDEEEDDTVTDWNEMATAAGTGTTGSGADLLVNDQSLRDSLLAQIISIGLVRSEKNIIRNG
jgi:hypothetical protein